MMPEFLLSYSFQDVWDNRITLKENMAHMGVAVDANSVVPKISAKSKMIKDMKKQRGLEVDEEVEEKPSTEVVGKLELEAVFEAKQTFRFTPTQVSLITYMMDKHGEDWEAMARDNKNHYQETAAKLRGMIRKFISIPEHYVVYCKEKGLIVPCAKPVVEEPEEEEMEEEEDEVEDKLDSEGEEAEDGGEEESS